MRVQEQLEAMLRLQGVPEDAESLALATRLQQEDDALAMRNALGDMAGDAGELSPSRYSFEQLMHLNETVGTVSKGAKKEDIQHLITMTYTAAQAESGVIVGKKARARSL